MTLEKDSGRRTSARLASRAVLACQSDERLVQMARAGNERAFEAIVDRYRRPLLRYCGRILPASRAEDAVQQALLNAHIALHASDEALTLKPWLFAITRNAALNMLRQNGWNYEQIPADFDGVRRPDQVYEERVRLEETVGAVAGLPQRQREALVMREFEGRSYEEIAAALDAGDGAVRQLLNRARVALRGAATAMIPPPLLARLAMASPSDGRRLAEVVSTIGAAGAAKAGATALVAGTLVVGAVQAPLPVGDDDKKRRERATLIEDAAAAERPPAQDPGARASAVAGNTDADRDREVARGRSVADERRGSGRGEGAGGADRSGEDERAERRRESREDRSAREDSGDEREDDGVRRHSGSSADEPDEAEDAEHSDDDEVRESDDGARVEEPDDDELELSSGTSGSGSDSGESGSGSSGSGSGDSTTGY